MDLKERIQQLVKTLQLDPHPEGGFFKETYRNLTQTQTSKGSRDLVTVIYFLLTSENCSKFHRIQSDEHWFWHEGSPLSIHLLTKDGHQILSLGPLGDGSAQPQQLVPAQTIFGSKVEAPDSYALVSCVVAPGFDFKDFELLEREELLMLFPEQEKIIHELS